MGFRLASLSGCIIQEICSSDPAPMEESRSVEAASVWYASRLSNTQSRPILVLNSTPRVHRSGQGRQGKQYSQPGLNARTNSQNGNPMEMKLTQIVIKK